MKTSPVMALSALSLVLCLALACGGCGEVREDFFAPFRTPFTAQIEGTAHGVAFCATLQAEAVGENGARAQTLIFYAPDSLADTVLARDGDGLLHLSVGGVTLEGVAAQTLAPLLDLFPTAGEVQSVTLTDQGYTRVQGDGFLLDFLPDGTPYRVQSAIAEVTVVSFQTP